MNYYNGIRAKLYNVARRNYKIKESGEVSLQFTISRDGKLQYVEGYSANETLKKLALKIVEESFPFTPFPEDLKNSSCPFSVIIDFKNN
jgi:outer membrane biosynthesis protein TonB